MISGWLGVELTNVGPGVVFSDVGDDQVDTSLNLLERVSIRLGHLHFVHRQDGFRVISDPGNLEKKNCATLLRSRSVDSEMHLFSAS